MQSMVPLISGTVLGKVHQSGSCLQCSPAVVERRLVEALDSADSPWFGRSHLAWSIRWWGHQVRWGRYAEQSFYTILSGGNQAFLFHWGRDAGCSRCIRGLPCLLVPSLQKACRGVNFKFNLLPEDNLAVKALNGLDLMAEYDARTVNIGAHYQLWKDHINLIAELNNGKYFSGGIYFKIHLKW